MHMTIEQAILKAGQTLINTGYAIKTEKWQGLENPPTMFEAMNVSISAQMPTLANDDNDDIIELSRQTGCNLPWAEKHFDERVSGKPLNPGNEYKHWPFYKRDKEMRPGDEFTHTYMERFWPKRAGKNEDYTLDNWGIRFRLGDLDDLINILHNEPNTRQAYLPIWFPEDTGAVHGGRVPCTLGYHFIQRRGFLHMYYFIRSCDIVRHMRDDIYMAVRLCQHIIYSLRSRTTTSREWYDIEPGMFEMKIVSLHCFLPEVAAIKKIYATEPSTITRGQ